VRTELRRSTRERWLGDANQSGGASGSGQVSLLDSAPYLIYVEIEGSGPGNRNLAIH
jgi:hypothetical protein